MKKVMVCGCGAQGSTICRRLDEEPNIEEVVCADYNLAAAEAVCKLMKKGTPKQVNAAHVDEIAKAAEGVEVRLIYDDVGSWGLGRKYLGRFRRAGVEVRCFMPVVFPWLTSHVNYRNHRKILVVDGRVGFTGGINIAQRYITGTKLGPWRDTHLRLEGEAVGMLQIVFITDWFFVTKKLLADYDKYLPKTHVRDETMIQIVTSGPDSDWASIMQAFFSAISHAQHHIYISSPYFLPPAMLLDALRLAARGGVRVQVMIPSCSDSPFTDLISDSYIGDLLDAGVELYRYDNGFLHAKLLIVDEDTASVGTANMDYRSLLDNLEVTAFIRDRSVVRALSATYDDDLASCRRIARETWRPAAWRRTLGDALRLVSPLM